MEIVLGIDKLIFISILSNKLPEESRARARRLGIGAALVMLSVLLLVVADPLARFIEATPRS